MFPGLWGFVFWLVWPWIVMKQTQKFFLLLSGRPLPQERADRLRRELAEITRDIKEANSSEAAS